MKLSIGGVLYDPASLDRLTLREIMALEKATGDLGRPLKWSAIRAMMDQAQSLGDAFMDSNDALWVVALMIYASKLRAGEDITFADAIDVELGSIDWVLEPGDEPDPSQDHTGAADPKADTGAGSRRVPQDHKRKSASRSSRD